MSDMFICLCSLTSCIGLPSEGAYISKNPSGDIEVIHPIWMKAFYVPLNGSIIDCSRDIDWAKLADIPDTCIARGYVTICEDYAKLRWVVRGIKGRKGK
jgi:hypothetical protein